MGDIAQILGIHAKVSLSASETAQAILAGPEPIPDYKKKRKKPKGMSREVFDLVGHDGLISAVESSKISGAGAFKDKRSNALKGKWIWAPFTSTARGDNAVMYHWQKADVQTTDYAYAKFNVRSTHLSPLYSDEEYNALLQSPSWTRSETDHLMYVVHKFDLRWPVIADRYTSMPPRCTEDLQARYLFVLAKIKAYRSSAGYQAAGGSSGGAVPAAYQANSNSVPVDIGMNLPYERSRRLQAEFAVRRTKEEDEELALLKEQLKAVEAVLRKNKMLAKEQSKNSSSSSSSGSGSATIKSESGASLGTGGGNKEKKNKLIADDNRGGNVVSKRTLSRSSGGAAGAGAGTGDSDEVYSKTELVYNEQILCPGKPSLQSIRINIPDQPNTLSITLLKKMVALLKDVGVPERPIATRKVCDGLDAVRKSAVALLSIQSQINKREKELVALRSKVGAHSVKLQSVPIPVGDLLASLPASPHSIPRSSSSSGGGITNGHPALETVHTAASSSSSSSQPETAIPERAKRKIGVIETAQAAEGGTAHAGRAAAALGNVVSPTHGSSSSSGGGNAADGSNVIHIAGAGSLVPVKTEAEAGAEARAGDDAAQPASGAPEGMSIVSSSSAAAAGGVGVEVTVDANAGAATKKMKRTAR